MRVPGDAGVITVEKDKAHAGRNKLVHIDEVDRGNIARGPEGRENPSGHVAHAPEFWAMTCWCCSYVSEKACTELVM